MKLKTNIDLKQITDQKSFLFYFFRYRPSLKFLYDLVLLKKD